MNKTQITKHELVRFYMDQLDKFLKIGIGRKTENGVVVTETLIQATMRRKHQLKSQIKGGAIVW